MTVGRQMLGSHVVDPGDEIVHMHLMPEHHQGRDVAARSRVFRGIEEFIEASLVAADRRVGLGLDEVITHPVAPVLGGTMRPGHIPTTPTFGQRRPVIHRLNARRQVHDPQAVRLHRAEEVTRNSHGPRRGMALEAVVDPLNDRLVGGFLLHHVEDAAQAWIHLGDLHERRSWDVSEINIVAEENGSWVAGVDVLALQRGLGEHQRLRSGIHAHRLLEGRQPTPLGVPFELHLACFDLPDQPGHRTRGGFFRILQRLGFQFDQMGRPLKISPTDRVKEQANHCPGEEPSASS